MAPYDPSKIAGLNDTEKLRIITAYLNHKEPQNVDWATAATHAGSKSKESYKKMFDAALKKLRATELGDENAGSGATEAAPITLKPTPKKGGRKKREAADDVAEDEESPKKKAKSPRKPRAKKDVAVKQEEPEAEADGDTETNGKREMPNVEDEPEATTLKVEV